MLGTMTPYDAPETPSTADHPALIDGFGRAVTYLRVSVTDRCDLRCTYCMAEKMVFLPKAEVLSSTRSPRPSWAWASASCG